MMWDQGGKLADIPARCLDGERYFATDAPAGQNLYVCTDGNLWVQSLNGTPQVGLSETTKAADDLIVRIDKQINMDYLFMGILIGFTFGLAIYWLLKLIGRSK